MPRLRTILAALVLLPLAACDETGGAAFTNVETALNDAVVERGKGNYEAAALLLRGALEREPENAEVRVELATTLLDQGGVGVLDIDRIARFMTEQAGSTEAGGARRAQATPNGACEHASDPAAVPFGLADVGGYAKLKAEDARIREADEALRSVVPSAIRGFDVCQSVAGGALVYDRDGALRDLRARDLSETQVRQALAVNGLTQLVSSYTRLAEAADRTATWYRLADGSVGVCADDEAALEASAREAAAGFGQALLSLDARAFLLGEDAAGSDVADIALDAYDEVERAVGDYCDES
ncbi:hypothetical protein RQM47_01370 [Rubrivirga sp. S365]|uniref:Tetratricopeptide repeat-containing protein n=1 Tax=Rubrivirga litoralis TaxID=3075598 RepID=A0ABU3BRV4_9BACT|nr:MULTISPECIES: tetratricopeptide repeat protein [unclassified Rubrivirga]MDT0632022.1 hypothetical protein [Rubrivirga sp. F394]MDT7855285.1 hypothetical protein [Rubrivirga sp. S365]